MFERKFSDEALLSWTDFFHNELKDIPKELKDCYAEIDRQRALIEWIIEKIPHRYDCPKELRNIYGDKGVCDCWKDDLVREIRAKASGEVNE